MMIVIAVPVSWNSADTSSNRPLVSALQSWSRLLTVTADTNLYQAIGLLVQQ